MKLAHDAIAARFSQLTVGHRDSPLLGLAPAAPALRASLRPNAYLRLIENRWVSTESSAPVRIIDKQAAPATTSRAVGVQARTLELLELRGLADEMVRLGNHGLAASIYGEVQ